MDVWVCVSPDANDDSLENAVCSPQAGPYDTWQHLSVDAVAQNEFIAVWLISLYHGGNKGVAIWDDASLTVAPVAATPVPEEPSPTPRASRPGPVPFDSNGLYQAMLDVQSAIQQIGGLLDRLVTGEPGSCAEFNTYYDTVVASPVYDGVPGEWGGPYGAYAWAVERALDSNHTVNFICSGYGGNLSRLDYTVARGGIDDALGQLNPAVETAAAMVGQ
jgi:hypothetical protein